MWFEHSKNFQNRYPNVDVSQDSEALLILRTDNKRQL